MSRKPSWRCITVLIGSHNFNNNGRFHTEDEQIVLMFGRLINHYTKIWFYQRS